MSHCVQLGISLKLHLVSLLPNQYLYINYLHYSLLSHPVAERSLPKQHFKEDHPQRPYIHLLTYLCLTVIFKTFRREVPIGSSALRSKFDACSLVLNDFAKAKVSYLQLSFMENDILWLQVVVDDPGGLVMDVF